MTATAKETRCTCKPWQQSWRAETPGVCATCGHPFEPYSRAREVCLKTEGCCLLPEHEGACSTVAAGGAG